jgi:3-phosphoshikimate 1-carboxyvinyltransferase
MITIAPAKNVLGAIRLPGDKSISHRYAMLAAIANGRSKFHNFASGQDCASTLACVGKLGAKVRRDEDTVGIEGCGPRLQAPSAALDCGNSGSTMRMLAGILAGQQFASELTGDDSLSRRPMARVIEPLTHMGARIRA